MSHQHWIQNYTTQDTTFSRKLETALYKSPCTHSLTRSSKISLSLSLSLSNFLTQPKCNAFLNFDFFRFNWNCWVSGSSDTRLLNKWLNKRVFIKNLTLWITILKTYGKPNVAPRMTQLQDSLTPHGKTTLAHFAFTRHIPTL